MFQFPGIVLFAKFRQWFTTECYSFFMSQSTSTSTLPSTFRNRFRTSGPVSGPPGKLPRPTGGLYGPVQGSLAVRASVVLLGVVGRDGRRRGTRAAPEASGDEGLGRSQRSSVPNADHTLGPLSIGLLSHLLSFGG